MKKIFILFGIFIIGLFFTTDSFANMAAPSEPDFTGNITFEENEDINVLSEELNIKVNGSIAEIEVIYKMQNTSNRNISIPAMFVSPNIEGSSALVLLDSKNVETKIETYYLDYNSKVDLDDWKYVVLKPATTTEFGARMVDIISFDINFNANSNLDVNVLYSYRLGGYPDYDFNVKYGIIEYFLRPASMWNGFSDLTINLYLDDDMPVLKRSNLAFEKIKKGVYQYKTDKLPETDLEIYIDQTVWQEFITRFNSPYLVMELMIFSPLIIIGLLIIIFIVVIIVKKTKNNKKEDY